MRPTYIALPFLLAVPVLVSCTSDEKLTCEDGDREANAFLDERWSDPNSCTAHCDCVFALSDIECPSGATLLQCGRAVHRDSQAQLAAVLDEVTSDICPRLDPSCFGGPSCVGVAACIDGKCTRVDPSDVDTGPADAGMADACVPGR